jgi:hypothetical protein
MNISGVIPRVVSNPHVARLPAGFNRLFCELWPWYARDVANFDDVSQVRAPRFGASRISSPLTSLLGRSPVRISAFGSKRMTQAGLDVYLGSAADIATVRHHRQLKNRLA